MKVKQGDDDWHYANAYGAKAMPDRLGDAPIQGKMKTRPVTVRDKDGNTVPADLILCPHCGGDAFAIYAVHGKHQHLQCIDCGETFCDGTCAAEVTNPPG